jgi:Putative zinc- or iron-chelating domain
VNRHERRAAAAKARTAGAGSPYLHTANGKYHLRLFQGERRTAREILGEGRTEEKVHELADNAREWATTLIDGLLEAAPPQNGIACGADCSWCCYLKVAVNEPEVLRIAAYLRGNLSEEQFLALRARVTEAAEATRGMDGGERFAARIPCPLLQDGNCLAYEVRPLSCIGYNSDDVEKCKHAWQERNPDLAVRCYFPQLQTAAAVAEGLEQGVRDMGLHGSHLELNEALRIALDRDGVTECWLAGRHPFAPAVAPEQVTRDVELRWLVSAEEAVTS